MKKIVTLAVAVLTSASVLSQAASARPALQGIRLDDRSHWKPVFVTAPAHGVDWRTLPAQAASGSTLPYYSNSIVSPLDGKTYNYSILGTDPTKTPASTTIEYVPLALRITFPGGVVLDPTKPGCGDTVSVVDRFYKSPLFDSVALTSNGVNVGTTQYVDGHMRAEFWNYVGGSGYHVLLKKAKRKVKVIDVTAPTGSSAVSGGCSGSGHDLGEIPYGAYTNLIENEANKYATTGQLPVLLAYNVVQTEGNQCCIIGFHGAYGRSGGTQVYATGSYTDPGEFGAIEDIYAWTHEIGEAFNDPFTNNGTPAWGHVGQVSGCQNNLEVGDPLTGSTAVSLPLHGFTYHAQELAFFDWFFRTPSNGTGGYYSFEGSFKTAQGACT